MLGLASVMPHFQTTDPVFVQEKVFDERLLAQLRPERIQDHVEATGSPRDAMGLNAFLYIWMRSVSALRFRTKSGTSRKLT
jgi:hypothetical protein